MALKLIVNLHNIICIIFTGAEPHVNTCYKHFYYFVTEFNLMNEKEFQPLKEMTQRICTDLVQAPGSNQATASVTATLANLNVSKPSPAPIVEEK